jgi:DNA-directed RNA polymerase specialized sigma24 family protein
VQDTLTKLSRVVPPRSTSEQACRAWLAKVVVSVFADQIRELTRDRSRIVPVGALNDLVVVTRGDFGRDAAQEAPAPDEDVFNQVVDGAGNELTGVVRENFLRDMQDLKQIATAEKHAAQVKRVAQREYGEVSKKTVNAIHVRMKRARRRIREYVEGLEEPRRSTWLLAIRKILGRGEGTDL